ncbi:MAG TPA: type IV pilus modification protein PilV [Steroidobacteraceae bacterium]|nr:type IV pilus modification protein PilV [Steroidobacteraceae bacterium]
MKTLRTTAGFSIVEALVALVVLSVGMLGIAALYVESLRAGRSAVYHTQAVNLAADMADRIRSNRTAGAAAWRLAADGAPATRNCVNAGVNCNPGDLAQDDQARWLLAIQRQLPGDGVATPDGTIAVDEAANPNEYTITVTWSEPGNEQLSYILTMQI